KVSFTINFTFHNPDFHTKFTILCKGFAYVIIDICSEGRQWDSSVFERFASCHLSSVQTSGDHYFYTFGTHSHSRSDSHFHSSSVGDTVLDLLCNTVCNQNGIKLRSFDFEDIDLNVLTCKFFQFFLQFVNCLTAFTDD